MARVRLENVSKVYDNGYQAVKEMNLDINDKEFVVLVGPSGCGKSTTLRMIAGLEDISDGKLFIDDNIVNDISSKDRDIAMVFQSYALYPHMTIRENMGFALKMKKLKKEEINQKVEEIAKILKLEDLLDRKPAQLSGGQRQRVALGRAMVRNPKVFLLDEPLSNLDAKLRVEMRTEIVRLHEKLDTTFIYVTHDQIEAMTMGDRIAVINEGRLVQFDTPLNLYFRPKNKFIAQFIGSPKMNLIETKLYKQGEDLCIDLFGEKLPLPASKIKDIEAYQKNNEKILFGIRSEEFSYRADSKLRVVFDNVEYMGSDSYGYLISSDKDPIVMRFMAQDPVRPKKAVPIEINLENSYLFDINTEECISYPSSKLDIKNIQITNISKEDNIGNYDLIENLVYSTL